MLCLSVVHLSTKVHSAMWWDWLKTVLVCCWRYLFQIQDFNEWKHLITNFHYYKYNKNFYLNKVTCFFKYSVSVSTALRFCNMFFRSVHLYEILFYKLIKTQPGVWGQGCFCVKFDCIMNFLYVRKTVLCYPNDLCYFLRLSWKVFSGLSRPP